MDYEKEYKNRLDAARYWHDVSEGDIPLVLEEIFSELRESEDERIKKEFCEDIWTYIPNEKAHKYIAWLEKQGSEPNWCHHKVDLSNCSEEYRKAYYDGWNNCNQQHSQCKSEENDVVKCLINGMKFYYEGNEEATWGTEKFSMKVRDILSWLEKQVPADEDEIVKGIRRGVAISLMNHIDANSKGMCLSNMECEDIENAIVNEDWDKVYGYMKKKLEKQGEKKPILDFNADDWYVSKVDGKIYNAKFIEQDSYKKIRRKEIEKAAFSTSGIIEQTDWFIKGAEWADEHPCCNWLEKQGTPKQVSIWKHWKDGIAGNGEGKPIYLVKIGNTYSLKSCLGFECDYIELSELDNLMLEKQGEQTDKIVERAKTEKQRVLITESDGEANIDWDTRSLQDVKLLLEYGLDYINKLDEKNCLSNTKPSMGDLKIISSLKDIIYGYWNSLPDSALEENEVAESCYRWLEKQCEQNLVNKVEPKFKVGDWVRAISSGNIFKILSVNDGLYRVLCYDGVEANYPIEEVEKDLTYWTIQDAKDGDVLVHNGITFIFKGIEDGIVKGLCSELSDSILNFGEPEHDKDYYPATKEQRDLLFQKMHEVGYMWDSKSKQLLSLKAEPSDIQTPTG